MAHQDVGTSNGTQGPPSNSKGMPGETGMPGCFFTWLPGPKGRVCPAPPPKGAPQCAEQEPVTLEPMDPVPNAKPKWPKSRGLMPPGPIPPGALQAPEPSKVKSENRSVKRHMPSGDQQPVLWAPQSQDASRQVASRSLIPGPPGLAGRTLDEAAQKQEFRQFQEQVPPLMHGQAPILGTPSIPSGGEFPPRQTKSVFENLADRLLSCFESTDHAAMAMELKFHRKIQDEDMETLNSSLSALMAVARRMPALSADAVINMRQPTPQDVPHPSAARVSQKASISLEALLQASSVNATDSSVNATVLEAKAAPKVTLSKQRMMPALPQELFQSDILPKSRTQFQPLEPGPVDSQGSMARSVESEPSEMPPGLLETEEGFSRSDPHEESSESQGSASVRGCTSLFMRNLPLDYGQQQTMDLIDGQGYRDQYDLLLWFPSKKSSYRKTSSVFINFRNCESASSFTFLFHQWRPDGIGTKLNISKALVQGFEANFVKYWHLTQKEDKGSICVPYIAKDQMEKVSEEIMEQAMEQKREMLLLRPPGDQDPPDSQWTATTVVIRNLPQDILTQEEAIEFLNDFGFRNTFDFLLYFPRKQSGSKNKNLAYAFVNFPVPSVAKACLQQLPKKVKHGMPLSVVISVIQGREACIDRFVQLDGRLVPYLPDLEKKETAIEETSDRDGTLPFQ